MRIHLHNFYFGCLEARTATPFIMLDDFRIYLFWQLFLLHCWSNIYPQIIYGLNMKWHLWKYGFSVMRRFACKGEEKIEIKIKVCSFQKKKFFSCFVIKKGEKPSKFLKHNLNSSSVNWKMMFLICEWKNLGKNLI